MRSYVPNTEKERQEMLAELGMSSFDELFADIPEDLRLKRELDLPAPLSEMELRDALMGYVLENEEGGPLFRGAGAYRHYIPSLVPQLAMRSEFYTAYTPYQAEMSQGMLQSLFEYQTVICRLTGLGESSAGSLAGALAGGSLPQISLAAKSSWRHLLSLNASRASGLLPTMARGTLFPSSPCLGKCFLVSV